MFCILKTFVAWVILIFIGINLAGFIMRGLVWAAPSLDEVCDGLVPTDRVQKIIEHETWRMRIGNALLNLLTWIAAVGYLYALYRYGGTGFALAGAVLIVTRVPDLLWEFRTGKKATSKKMPSGPVHIIAIILMFATLPLIWNSLCR